MPPPKPPLDPLWQCLCPAWARSSPSPYLSQPKRLALKCLSQPPLRAPSRPNSTIPIGPRRRERDTLPETEEVHHPLRVYYTHERLDQHRAQRQTRLQARKEALLAKGAHRQLVDFRCEDTETLYGQLRGLAMEGKYHDVVKLVECLVRERGEKPSLLLYNALVLANVSAPEGAAWRVGDLLEQMVRDGLQPDTGTCHAALKVLAVHPDHLLRADVLAYMRRRWFSVNAEGWQDVVAGMLREGCLEMAGERLAWMQGEGRVRVEGWVWDLAVYAFGEAGEMAQAGEIMRTRLQSGELDISRSLWWFILDRAAQARHHPTVSLVWSSQVNPGYLNPAAGMCTQILATAAAVGDTHLATSVFTHLSKVRANIHSHHYTLLQTAYLSPENYNSTTSARGPDFSRALSILTIPTTPLPPTATRPLYNHFAANPTDLPSALATLHNLHNQNRRIPLSALNLLIEAHISHADLPSALNIYKQIHTFTPPAQAAKKPLGPDVETFNLLFKGCRTVQPAPAEGAARFLVGEMLALRVKPSALTYDRLVLVFVEAAAVALRTATSGRQQQHQQQRSPPANAPTSTSTPATPHAQALSSLCFAHRHFTDMTARHWLPRAGTIVQLAVTLARAGDDRCWDVLEVVAEKGKEMTWAGTEERGEGWVEKVRGKVGKAWEEEGAVQGSRRANGDGSGDAKVGVDQGWGGEAWSAGGNSTAARSIIVGAS